jgi:hypothetical protein
VAREAKAEMDGEIRRRELVVSSDWVTTSSAAVGTLFVLWVTAVHLVHLAHGKFGTNAVLHSVSDYVLSSYLIFMAAWFVWKVNERTVRFACGLLGVAQMIEIAASVFWRSNPGVVTPVLFLLRLGGFALLAFEGIQWFRRNVKLA